MLTQEPDRTTVPTANDVLVPETLLKKRKSTEKSREEKVAKAEEARKVGLCITILQPRAIPPSENMTFCCVDDCLLYPNFGFHVTRRDSFDHNHTIFRD